MVKQPADEQAVQRARQLQEVRRQLEDELASRREHLRLRWIRAYRRLLDQQQVSSAQFEAVLALLDQLEQLTPEAVAERLQHIFPDWRPAPTAPPDP